MGGVHALSTIVVLARDMTVRAMPQHPLRDWFIALTLFIVIGL